uniref:LRR receptor-like serine/threonine-protein kinase GSO1 n=1 Tax=Ananas comosus var. bracteatus TaxID=296719 RepID=A0A6V7QQ22_ANACO|nr:unnamed protein product [Ananas comosus var. bracteatus]
MAYSISISLVHIIVFLWIQIKSASPSELSCNEFERSALLKLKQSFNDPLNALSSWKGFDCCSWKGVECGNYTDRVIGLNLSRKSLEGEINPSLLELKHIISLDLSLNDFNGTDIPDFIGSLANLRYLNLSNSNFVGSVPHHLGNLSRLQYLDLGSDESISISGLSDDDLSWVSRLSSLRYLDMRMINLRKATNWLHEVNKLPSLSVLRLSSCNIDTIPQSILHLNLTYLTVFDLSSNNIRSTLPEWLFNMTNLNVLDLSRNFLSGPIPGIFQNMPFLKVLNLGHNSLSGYIPLSIDHLSSLEELYLNSNRLNGTLPQIIGQMSTLTILNVSSNLLTGIVMESHFANLSRLNILNLSFNNFSLQVSSNWTPPFRLDSIYMSSCRLGPRFPPWLITQKGYAKLDIGNAGVVDSLPTWFWSLTSEIVSLNLSLNQIKGSLPPSLHSISITFMDLSSNLFEGPLPRLHHRIQMLQLNDNSFEGTIPLDLGHDMPMLRCLQLSNNLFHGPIPRSLCELDRLVVLWLANNNLSGAIPDCWSNLGALEILDLGNNNLYGRIPESFGYMNSLVSLHLNNNNLFGELPSSLKNCTLLTLLDLSNNQLSGNIPTWIPNSLTNLIILRLRSNRFIGPIPPELSRLNSLQLLDISINKLSGTIPISFGNFTSMKKTKMKGTLLGEPWSGYEEHLMVCINGRQLRYTKTLSLVTSVDLSSNNLYGEIPSEITSLVGLLVLNLSKNGLSGEIPQNIGNMGCGGDDGIGTLWLELSVIAGFVTGVVVVLSALLLQRSWRLMFFVAVDKAFDWVHAKIGRTMIFMFLSSSLSLGCVTSERRALLNLKEGLQDPLNELASWKGFDCCSWNGVDCDHSTGFISSLKLNNTALGGKISPSILELKHLTSLDLSLNDFNETNIPEFVGSLRELKYLNLSSSNFGGPIPHQLGNLSKLEYLDLGAGWSSVINRLSDHDLGWVSNLFSLRYIDMGGVNLTMANNWLDEFNKLPSLLELRLSSCSINVIPYSLPFLNLSSLTVLDLSSNNINSTLPPWIFNMTSLSMLDLGVNAFHGEIPDAFKSSSSLSTIILQFNHLEGKIPTTMGTLCKIEYVDFSWNNFSGEITELLEGLSQCHPAPNLTQLILAHNLLSGSIPSSIENLSSLQVLFLQSNRLTGVIPKGLGRLSMLRLLDVSSNLLNGVISEAHFTNLSRLKEFYISLNNLSLTVSSDWVPPFQLNIIYMPSCHLGPDFPAWLRTQKGFSKLDISNAGISDTLPDWFWNLTSEIAYLNFSQNNISGRLPSSLQSISITLMDLSSNRFAGSLPLFNPNITVLHLYDNSFEGTVPLDIGETLPMLKNLLLSNNLITGTIPSSVCEMEYLEVLGLANNFLSGELPRCWGSTQLLKILDFGNNNLHGSIPASLGSLTFLVSLHLNNNSLSGKLPESLKNCTGLVALDLGDNRLAGEIPIWMGESFPNLMVLRLHSNRFVGKIPTELSLLTSLQVLDIGNNSLSGTIPISFGNFTAMIETQKSGDLLPLEQQTARENTDELTNLAGLIDLDLSNNELVGEIPAMIGDLKMLLSLDLSRNKLYGPIPPSLSTMTSLNHLNLSYNNLSGRIPTGSQLQTFNDLSIYVGNTDLCGPPLSKKCPGDDELTKTNSTASHENESEAVWFYSSIPPGFAFGLLLVYGVMLFKSTWRFAFFLSIDSMYDWFYVTIGVNMRRLRRKFGAE